MSRQYELAPGVLVSFQNALCLSWKLFGFLEFIFPAFKNMDGLSLRIVAIFGA